MTPRPARKTETAAKRRSRSPGKDQAQPCLGGSSSLVVLAGGCCARPRTTPPQPQAEPMKWSFVPGSPGVQISRSSPAQGHEGRMCFGESHGTVTSSWIAIG